MAASPPGRSFAERPEIWVNCAASLDGRIAFAGGRPAPLSSPEDLQRVHRIRAEVDGVVVGAGTVLADDPSLRVRWELTERPAGAGPARIVIAGARRLPPSARVLDGSIPTYVVLPETARRRYPTHVHTVRAGRDRVDLAAAFGQLASLGLRRLLVEGGAQILSNVLREGLFDRFTVYYAPLVIGGTDAPTMVAGVDSRSLEEAYRVRLESLERLGEGFVAAYRPIRPP